MLTSWFGRLLVLSLLGTMQPAPDPLRILFVGNSLTYQNDLPGMVCTLARAAGRPVVCESVAKPDASLEDHWHSGEARKAIAAGRWDIVVLQQGPSALPESRRLLIEYTKRFDAEIKQAGARTALYMVWPSQSRRGDAEGVSQSYRAAAKAVAGTLLPVGDAWREAWAIDRNLPLYAADKFHPSGSGTYLAALVAYRHLLGAPAPATPVLGGALAHAEVLQRVASQSRSAVQ
ncbi:MAG: SGNH/GDSL hydrolase family protein [Acidobacteriota bacterium]|nr:SGNH/GDSL hydrolase family protein [Acidobacteriota bacterium]